MIFKILLIAFLYCKPGDDDYIELDREDGQFDNKFNFDSPVISLMNYSIFQSEGDEFDFMFKHEDEGNGYFQNIEYEEIEKSQDQGYGYFENPKNEEIEKKQDQNQEISLNNGNNSMNRMDSSMIEVEENDNSNNINTTPSKVSKVESKRTQNPNIIIDDIK